MGRKCRRGRGAPGCGGAGGKLAAALRWHLDWSDKLEWLQDIAEETGVEPKALRDRPEVWPHLEFVWSAWWELHSDRLIGFGVGPIPFSAIDRYADRYGIENLDRFDAFLGLIRAMDEVFLAWSAKRAKPKPTSGN